MPEATAAIYMTGTVATAIGVALAAIGGSLSLAVATLYKASQTNKAEANGLYRELAKANTEDAVGREKQTTLLREIVKGQEAAKAGVHARLDRIESKMDARR